MKVISLLFFSFGILTLVNLLLFLIARKLKAGNIIVIITFMLFINSILFDFITK